MIGVLFLSLNVWLFQAMMVFKKSFPCQETEREPASQTKSPPASSPVISIIRFDSYLFSSFEVFDIFPSLY
jgi:hypothetical protein